MSDDPMRALHSGTPATDARVVVHAARFVSLELASKITGYSVRAMQTKIDRGVWLDGHEYIRAPDGRILVDIKGYERWVLGQRRPA